VTVLQDKPTPHGLSWGIVGPGQIAGVFARSLERLGVGELRAVCGRSMERTQAFCRLHGGQAYGSLEEVLEADVEALYIATPHPMHAEPARRALEAGKAVLCEKPLTASAAATEALLQAGPGVLLEAWMYRAHPLLERALELVRSGQLGTLERMQARFGYHMPVDPEHRIFNAELGGGAILDIGGYPLSLALACAAATGDGAVPRLADLRGKQIAGNVDTEAHAKLDFPGGLQAEISVSVQADWGQSATLWGSLGSLSLADPFVPGGERLALEGQLSWEIGGQVRHERVAAEHDCYALEALELGRMLAHGERQPRWPMVGSAESLRLAQLMQRWRQGLQG
jgi:predicted dehydrogenase